MEATELHDKYSLSLSFDTFANGHVDFGSEPGSPFGSYPIEDNPTREEKKDDYDDDYVAELTRQMTNYMLQDEDKHKKSWGGSGSPQSTLWSPFGFGSGSPIGPSREPSPPLAPVTQKYENMKESKQSLINDQIRLAQTNFRKIKEEREKEKRLQSNRNDDVYWNRNDDVYWNRNDDVYLNKNDDVYWNRTTTFAGYGGNYHRGGSGMKAVFLDGSGSRPGSGGTGVFLPRGTGTGVGTGISTGTALETQKKTGCSTVLIPARVVEALKLHFHKVGAPSYFTPDFPPRHDALLIAMDNKSKIRSSGDQRRQSYAAAVANSHREPPANLPPEWTY